MSKEKQIETMFADISEILHKHIDIEPYQYLSVEYAKKYNNMRVCIDIPSIINELYDMGYRKQIEGEWEVYSDEYEICASEFTCSLCKESFVSSDLTDEQFLDMIKFCPNCGAKMDGERKEKCE